ncbi:MAG: hypothetical protein ABR878_05560 [Roseiarcus sp.]
MSEIAPRPDRLGATRRRLEKRPRRRIGVWRHRQLSLGGVAGADARVIAGIDLIDQSTHNSQRSRPVNAN